MKFKNFIITIILILPLFLTSCTEKLNNPFTNTENITITETNYTNKETNTSFDFDVNLQAVNSEIYDEEKELIDKLLKERDFNIEEFKKNLEKVDIVLYDIKDIPYLTRISYACTLDDDFKNISMEDEETLKLLNKSLSNNIMENAEIMEEADFKIGKFQRVPYVKYSFIDEKTNIKVVVIQTLIIEDGKIHSFSFFTDGTEYVNSIKYFHEILNSFKTIN